MRIYQAGPMRGLPLYNFNTFEQGKRYLTELGHEVVSPHDIDIEEGLVAVKFHYTNGNGMMRCFTEVKLTPLFSIERALKRDFAAITQCDAISLLPGAAESQGTAREISVARWCGLHVFAHDPDRKTFEPAVFVQEQPWRLGER